MKASFECCSRVFRGVLSRVRGHVNHLSSPASVHGLEVCEGIYLLVVHLKAHLHNFMVLAHGTIPSDSCCILNSNTNKSNRNFVRYTLRMIFLHLLPR